MHLGMNGLLEFLDILLQSHPWFSSRTAQRLQSIGKHLAKPKTI